MVDSRLLFALNRLYEASMVAPGMAARTAVAPRVMVIPQSPSPATRSHNVRSGSAATAPYVRNVSLLSDFTVLAICKEKSKL